MKKEKLFFEGYDGKVRITGETVVIKNKLYSIADIESAELIIVGKKLEKIWLSFNNVAIALMILSFLLISIVLKREDVISLSIPFIILGVDLLLGMIGFIFFFHLCKVNISYRNGDILHYYTIDGSYASHVVDAIRKAVNYYDKQFQKIESPPKNFNIPQINSLQDKKITKKFDLHKTLYDKSGDKSEDEFESDFTE